ncbi:MAG: NADH:flavin oxidoreductase [Ignavibacteriaceae bacterium]|nr:NADH:flavin oxidoreductase [Ignavibacteriaceae bacterium]
MADSAFNPYKLNHLLLRNRIVRSATYEGGCDINGYPGRSYERIYKTLSANNAGLIITGFAFISPEGRAMQKGQAGMDRDDKIKAFQKITDTVHSNGGHIIMQIAHTGRQTREEVTGSVPYSSTKRRSVYFRQRTKLLDDDKIKTIIQQFVNAAVRAKEAGFDGIQLHAAHGYLIHQFLLPETNNLSGEYGINKSIGLGTAFLNKIYDGIREKCGSRFLVLIKISGNHDLSDDFYPDKFRSLIQFLDRKGFDAIEISCGTMDYALNIFRGELNLERVFEQNMIFKTKSTLKRKIIGYYLEKFISSKFREFVPVYNLFFADRAKELTNIPVISVGGFRSKSEIEKAISGKSADLVAMSRPFICEPDIINKMTAAAGDYRSICRNCNDCVFMCDSGRATTCYSVKQPQEVTK